MNRKFDLENDSCDLGPVDLVVSMEVAEHLPEDSSDKYVSLLTKMSNNVLMTAATPGQGGTNHVNEQPNEYWIEKFEKADFLFRSDLTERLRLEWKDAGVEYFYANNVMVFRCRRDD